MVKLFSGIAHSSCILDSIYHKLVRYSYNVSVTRTQTEVLEVFFFTKCSALLRMDGKQYVYFFI